MRPGPAGSEVLQGGIWGASDVSSSFWPGSTAQPQPAGTHRVVRRDPEAPSVPTYLARPDGPDAAPAWSAYPSDAGLWSRDDAHQLAELHARLLAGQGGTDKVAVERRRGRWD